MTRLALATTSLRLEGGTDTYTPLVRHDHHVCGCSIHTTIYTDHGVEAGRFSFKTAVCLRHLPNEQLRESYFGRIYGPRADTVTPIALSVFARHLEMEMTN